MSENKRPLVTILTPVFNEMDGLNAYRDSLVRMMDDCTEFQFEVLLVDDGSADSSWRMIQQMCKEDQRFTGLRLSRNFGAHRALAAGMDVARGDLLMTLACDLQDPPETFYRFVEEWKQGKQIVWGKRRSREDEGWRIVASNVFFSLLRKYAMPKGSRFTTGSFFLIDKKVLECVRQLREQNRITFALVAWTGFEQGTVEYDRKARTTGKSGWRFGQMLGAMYDTFLGFSPVPARLITGLAVGFSLFSLLLFIYVGIAWLIGNPLMGWTSFMAGLFLSFGLVFFILGVMAEYLSRIYSESTARPLYFISQRTDEDD